MSNHTLSPKTCTKCGITYPTPEGNFSRSKRNKDGYNFWCKSCYAAYRAENRERILGQKRQAHQERKNDLEYLETRRQSRKRYRETYPDRIKSYNREYRRKNRARRSDYNRQWHLDHPGWFSNYKSQYDREHPEKVRIYNFKRRARKLQIGGSHTIEDINILYKSQKGLCWWCSVAVGDKFHVDHRIPVSRGGSDSANNLTISCRFCNQSKGNKMPWEWIGRLL